MSDSDRTFTNLPDAIKAIKLDIANKQRRVKNAVRKTVRKVRPIVSDNIPKAFGELRGSLHILDAANGSALIADAPHAAAVEKGSKPHKPPLAPLIAWVTLRGMQGLSASGSVRRSANVHQSAKSIASALHAAKGRSGAAAWRGHVANLYSVSASPKGNLGGMEADPHVVAIARAIQNKIAQRGTKPVRFMGSAVPDALRYLRWYTDMAMRDRASE